MEKLSDYLYIPPMGEVIRQREAAAAEQSPQRHRGSRAYGAALRTRSNSDWTVTRTSSNYETFASLTALRARARQMCRDDAYFRKFLQMAESNVIGQAGIQIDPRAKRAYKGQPLDKDLNDRVKAAFYEWGSDPRSCSLTGKLDLQAQQRLFVRTLLRDGEVLVVKYRNGPWGFRLKFIDPGMLDEMFCTRLQNGNRVIMSVEVDGDDRPVAYWLTPLWSDSMFNPASPSGRTRVDAKDVIHAFIVQDDESQTRGITWFHAALLSGKNRNEFRRAVLTQAKVTAMSKGLIIPPEDDQAMADSWVDDEGRAITPEVDITPGSMTLLPPGYDFKEFDPKQPTQNHAEYNKTLIAEDASGLGVHYFSLAGDMSEVNYSSARVGLNEEREGIWRILQDFTITHFCNPVFEEWVLAAMASGNLRISAAEYDRLGTPYWQPRGWDYIDPQKEINAQLAGVESGLLTVSGVLAKRGVDIRDHLDTIKRDREMFEEAGIPYPTAPAPAGTPQVDDPADEPTPAAKKKRDAGYTNGHLVEDEFVS